MLRSMTGFGRVTKGCSFGQLNVELQSINRKYLEILIFLPKELAHWEYELRKKVGNRITRGQILLKVYISFEAKSASNLLPDPSFLKALKKGWEKIAFALEEKTHSIDLPFIMENLPSLEKRGVHGTKEKKELWACVEESLDLLLEMKSFEGEELAKDIAKRIREIRKIALNIKRDAKGASSRIKEKLLAKIHEAAREDWEDRLVKEVTFFAEKVDVTEELVRLDSHIKYFEETMRHDFVGRKLEFITQEIGREVNTIASKAMDAKISQSVIAIKEGLEKIREQVQNIE